MESVHVDLCGVSNNNISNLVNTSIKNMLPKNFAASDIFFLSQSGL